MQISIVHVIDTTITEQMKNLKCSGNKLVN